MHEDGKWKREEWRGLRRWRRRSGSYLHSTLGNDMGADVGVGDGVLLVVAASPSVAA